MPSASLAAFHDTDTDILADVGVGVVECGPMAAKEIKNIARQTIRRHHADGSSTGAYRRCSHLADASEAALESA